MPLSDLNAQFRQAIQSPPNAQEVKALAQKCAAAGRKPTQADRVKLAAALAHTAFLAPDETGVIYDALAEGWRGSPVKAEPIATLDRAPEPPADGLWDAYWSVVEDAAAGKLDAIAITVRTVELGGMSPEKTVERVAEMSYLYPGIAESVSAEMPRMVTMETLNATPEGSLGQEFRSVIVDNEFDLEVLDRNAIGLAALPHPLDYLNTRILQAHDLWHITAGYETTSLHEIALSAFQMSQFGHNYSAQFLSVVASVGSQAPGYGYQILMDSITSAWVHGRETPPLMAVDWEAEWHKPVAQVRTEQGISAYNRPYRADIFERAGPLVKVIGSIKGFFGMFTKLFRRTRAA